MAEAKGAVRVALPRSLVGTWAIGALSLTAFRLADASAVVMAYGLSPTRLYQVLMSLGSVLAAFLAIWLVRSGWTLSGVPLLALFLSTFGMGLAVEGPVRALVSPLVSTADPFEVELVTLNVVATLATVLAVLWFQHFPAPVPRADLVQATTSGALARVRRWWLIWTLPAKRVWLVFGALHFALSSAWVVGLPLDPTSVRLAVAILAALTGIGYLRTHWQREAEAEVIRRAEWVIEALLIALVLVGFAVVFEFQVHVLGRTSGAVLWPHAVLLPCALISFVGSLGVSVLYRGAIDPALIIAKTTVLGGVGLLLTCLFLIGEEVLSNLVAEWFGLPPLLGAVATGLLAGLAFAPLYRWANDFVQSDAGPPAP